MNANSSIALNPAGGCAIATAKRVPLWHRTQEILIQVFDRIGERQERAAARRRLMTLDDRVLGDLGLTRDSVDAEGGKPFWRA